MKRFIFIKQLKNHSSPPFMLIQRDTLANRNIFTLNNHVILQFMYAIYKAPATFVGYDGMLQYGS